MEIKLPFAVILLAYLVSAYYALSIIGVFIKAWGDMRNTQQLSDKIKSLVLVSELEEAKKKPMGFSN